MRKVFVGSIPLQKPQLRYYQAQDNSTLQCENKVSHPLILLVQGYAQNHDHVVVVLCMTESEVADRNALHLKEELIKIRDAVGFSLSIEIKRFPDNEQLDAHIHLFSTLISCLEQDDNLYLDITFGTKPTPIILMNVAYFLAKTRNVSVECICYGRIPDHKDHEKPGFIYDVTSLYRLTTTIDVLSRMKVDNPEIVLKKLLGLHND